MKRFICRFGILIAIAVALATVADYVITTGLKKTDIRKYSTWNDIYKGGLDADLLVIGASNAWSGFNTYIIDTVLNLNSYNLGMDGHGIDFQIIRYDTYRRFNSKPKTVLINTIIGGTLGTSEGGVSAHSQYEREQFFPYIYDKELISRVAEAKKFTWVDTHFPLVRYFGYRDEIEEGIMAYFGKTEFFDGGMHKGYKGSTESWDRGSLSKDTLYTEPLNLKAVGLLDSFAKELTEEGIKVVFVKSPIYFQLKARFTNIGQCDSVFESISRKYDIPILNYYNSIICVDSNYFVNPGHPNKKGSELFTFELCKDLDSLGITQDSLDKN